MKSVWIVQKISPYPSISALAGSLGTAVRMAKKEEPDAEWERMGCGGGICGGEGYTLTGRRKVSWEIAARYGREFEWVSYRFLKRRLPSSPFAAKDESSSTKEK